MPELPASFFSRLVPEVLDFATASFGLKEDLSRLEMVHRAGAPEAVVLYGCRILEVLAREALVRIGQAPSNNVFSNLQVLEHFNRVGNATCYLAHGLRRLGNLVRHIEGRLLPPEAAVST